MSTTSGAPDALVCTDFIVAMKYSLSEMGAAYTSGRGDQDDMSKFATVAGGLSYSVAPLGVTDNDS
jgi:hypothetical protein